MTDKPSVYIETSVVSYFTSQPNRDLIIAARQQLTHEWWENYLPQTEAFISTLVIQEAEVGDTGAAKQRLEAIADLPVLELTLTFHKYLAQNRFARSIPGHQETFAHFQDLTVCLIRFRP